MQDYKNYPNKFILMLLYKQASYMNMNLLINSQKWNFIIFKINNYYLI